MGNILEELNDLIDNFPERSGMGYKTYRCYECLRYTQKNNLTGADAEIEICEMKLDEYIRYPESCPYGNQVPKDGTILIDAKWELYKYTLM